ncbi:MAG: AIR synthase family protein [Clostridiales bacterium]|nr:AIR synthase family protein [Clostridiales bacterium]
MEIGKLTNEELRELVFAHLPKLSERTMIGANIGADCAWIDLGEQILVSSSDPITAGGMQSGTLAIHVSCNDIASTGVRPIGILIVLLAPADATKDDIVRIVEQAATAAGDLGVDIVGGHTEVTDAVNTFVVTSTAFGIISSKSPFIPGKARPGDKLLMTKTAAIEGTWIIAMNHTDRISGEIPGELIEEARSFIKDISVVEEGDLSGKLKVSNDSDHQSGKNGTYSKSESSSTAVNLMHDSTEGGILGAAYEMAEYSGIGLNIYRDAIPVHPATREICRVLSIDPLRLISSGTLLISTPYPDLVVNKLRAHNILCTEIGEFTDREFSLIDADGRKMPFDPPGRDQVYKL